MAQQTVVLLGPLPLEGPILETLASEFGFSFMEAASLSEALALNERNRVVAVLFNPGRLGLCWDETLRCVVKAFPNAFPILCHGFADYFDWPEAADAGAFHSIPVPFNVAELRQSLGFVWMAMHKQIPQWTTETRYLDHVQASEAIAAELEEIAAGFK